MRKNIQDVMTARDARKKLARPSCSTDGVNVFSYSTCILAQDSTGRYIINMTSYSRTTSTQQSALRGWYPYAVTVEGLPRGADAWDVITAYHRAQASIPVSEPRIYRVIRFYRSSGKRRNIRQHMTRSEAQEWCSRDDTRKAGVWFDGFDLMRGYREEVSA